MLLKSLALTLVAALLASAPVASAREITPDAPLPRACGYDRSGMLAMDFETFDHDVAEGWRPLAERPGCELAAAEALAAYRVENGPRLAPDQLRSLRWHEGQLRAIVGDTPDAIDLLRASKAGEPLELTRLYTDATIAFLRHDRRALNTARRRLAAIPKPANFERDAAALKANTGMEVSWPPNLDVVDGLVACFKRPYAEAYQASCRPRRSHG